MNNVQRTFELVKRIAQIEAEYKELAAELKTLVKADEPPPPTAPTLTEKVLEFFRQSPDKLVARTELMAARLGQSGSVDATVQNLISRGKVVRVEHGVYRLGGT